jgi:hypothetical protein
VTDIERQILLNQLAIIEALMPLAKHTVDGTRGLLRSRYEETAKLVREKQGG